MTVLPTIPPPPPTLGEEWWICPNRQCFCPGTCREQVRLGTGTSDNKITLKWEKP